MTYTMKHSEWQWLIEPDPNSKRYLLKYKRPTVWMDCNSFASPEEAADAVAQRRTGQKEWDSLKPDAPVPNLASWLIDPTGGPLSAVTEILKAVILPNPPETGNA